MDSDASKLSRCRLRHLRRHRCAIISAAFILLIALLILILAVTVFRVRNTTTTINSVHLSGFRVTLNVPNLRLDFNLTLDLNLTAHNPNHAGFRYAAGGTAELFYRSAQIGEASIPPGEVAAGKSVTMVVSVTIFAGRLAGGSAVYADVASGSVAFQTATRIPGRVSVIGIKHHLVTYSNCDVKVNVTSQAVENADCTYKAKL